jgi:hypothetical protein
MAALITTVPTLAVSVVFCIWKAYHVAMVARRQRLHERVAFMLWTAAHEVV